jgi:hypothetical protein
MRYTLFVSFGADRDVHTALFQAGINAQDLVIAAVREYVANHNLPAGDPAIQKQIVDTALHGGRLDVPYAPTAVPGAQAASASARAAAPAIPVAAPAAPAPTVAPAPAPIPVPAPVAATPLAAPAPASEPVSLGLQSSGLTRVNASNQESSSSTKNFALAQLDDS